MTRPRRRRARPRPASVSMSHRIEGARRHVTFTRGGVRKSRSTTDLSGHRSRHGVEDDDRGVRDAVRVGGWGSRWRGYCSCHRSRWMSTRTGRRSMRSRAGRRSVWGRGRAHRASSSAGAAWSLLRGPGSAVKVPPLVGVGGAGWSLARADGDQRRGRPAAGPSSRSETSTRTTVRLVSIDPGWHAPEPGYRSAKRGTHDAASRRSTRRASAGERCINPRPVSTMCAEVTDSTEWAAAPRRPPTAAPARCGAHRAVGEQRLLPRAQRGAHRGAVVVAEHHHQRDCRGLSTAYSMLARHAGVDGVRPRC